MVASHLLLEPGQISAVVLTCGDPARAEQIASLMQHPTQVAFNREYRTFVGTYEGQRLTVTSHGVGAGGAAICFEELIGVGARVLIRLGTCGSLQSTLAQGDLIVCTGAAREDGVTPRLVPLGFPALASATVTAALQQAADSVSAPHSAGIVLSSDMFYPGVLDTQYDVYAKAGVLGVEMECGALFIIAALRGVQAGAIVTVDGSPLRWSDGDYAPHGATVARAKQTMLEIGLRAGALLSSRLAL